MSYHKGVQPVLSGGPRNKIYQKSRAPASLAVNMQMSNANTMNVPHVNCIEDLTRGTEPELF